MVSSFLLKKGDSVVGLRRNWKRRWFLWKMTRASSTTTLILRSTTRRGRCFLRQIIDEVPEVSMRGRHRPKQGEATHYFELWDVKMLMVDQGKL